MTARRAAAGILGWGLATLTVPALALPAAGAVPAAPERPATVSILHAIPTGPGVVDVYAGRVLLVDDLPRGGLRTVRMTPGSHDLAIYPDGRGPGASAPLATAPGARIRTGGNVTVAAHATAAGSPVLTAFTNDTSTVGMGMGRLTVRNLAATPRLDVRTRGSVLLPGIGRSGESSAGLAAGPYVLSVVRAGTRDGLLRPFTVTIRNEPGRQDMGTTTIVYLWGPTADGSLRRTVQEVPIDLD